MDKFQVTEDPIAGYQFAIDKGDAGDPKMVIYLLNVIQLHLRQGDPLPEPLSGWLDSKIGQLLSGVLTKNVFKMTPGAGRPSKFSEELELLIGDLVLNSNLGKHKSETGKPGAFTVLATQFGVSVGYIEQCYRKRKAEINQLSDPSTP